MSDWTEMVRKLEECSPGDAAEELFYADSADVPEYSRAALINALTRIDWLEKRVKRLELEAGIGV